MFGPNSALSYSPLTCVLWGHSQYQTKVKLQAHLLCSRTWAHCFRLWKGCHLLRSFTMLTPQRWKINCCSIHTTPLRKPGNGMESASHPKKLFKMLGGFKPLGLHIPCPEEAQSIWGRCRFFGKSCLWIHVEVLRNSFDPLTQNRNAGGVQTHITESPHEVQRTP